MKKQNIIILSILAIGSLSSIAYATGTVITDSGITTSSLTTNNLTVSGSCTGCTSEPNFNSYSLIINETVSGTTGSLGILTQVGTDGTVFGQNNGAEIAIIKSDGTIINISPVKFFPSRTALTQQSQSIDGTYKIILNSTEFINIYKNQILLQSIKLNTSSAWTSAQESIGISSDGKYIAIFGNDISSSVDRVQIYMGS